MPTFDFEPRIQHASYVDNLALTADTVYLSARGYIVMESFWELLGLELDHEKSYFWATQAQDRRLLVTLGLAVKEHRRELGGYLTFGARHRVADMSQRLELLQPLWQALRRSKAPAKQKWAAVATKLWPMIFHGAAACWLSTAVLDKLRARMAWALGWTCAGAGPDLRALTEGPMDLDPAFFQIWTCFRDFRRLVSKSVFLRQDWARFMFNFQGTHLAGPFSTMLRHADCLGWGFAAPPEFTDHRGLAHDFLLMPRKTLRWLVEEAWARVVLRKQASRAALTRMGEVDLQLAREVGRHCTSQQKAWLGQIRAGAAITAEQQARFDLSKVANCLHCQTPDSKGHRLFDCATYPREGLVRDAEDTPPLCELLLPTWHAHMQEHLQDLMQVTDDSWNWTTWCVDISHVDVFTDGSCQFGEEDMLALGAWAVVCAQLGVVVASGQVPGLCQTIDRCELLAVIVALRWAAAMGCGMTIWTDSKFVFEGISTLLNGESLSGLAHPDLWTEAESLLECGSSIFILLVPSHVDPRLCDDPVAEWATHWNGTADRQAGIMNEMRNEAFKSRHTALLRYRRRQRRRLQALADQYIRVAEVTQAMRPSSACVEDETVAGPVQQPEVIIHDSFADLFPVGWTQQLTKGGGLGDGEKLAIAQRILTSDESAVTKFRVSWIELVFLVVVIHCCGCRSQSRTLAYWVTSFRKILRPLLMSFGARGWIVRSSLEGVSFPLEALVVGVSLEELNSARSLFREWRGGRTLRKVADLARPL